jgi:hypothetical protein
MKKWLILGILIVFALISGYRWHANQPEQKINGVVDHLIEAVAYHKLNFRQRSDVHDAIREVMAETVDFQGEAPLPEGEVSHERIFSQLDFMHSVTTLREFTELDRSLMISGAEAQVIRTTEIKFAAGKSFRDTQTWKLVFDLELDQKWRIIRIRGERIEDN